MVVQTLYCGRCGALLLPGAAFCGRCGAPQMALASMPAVARAMAAPPSAPPAAYGYRVAQPGAFPAAGRVKVPQVMVIGGLIVILAVAAVVITAFALSKATGGAHPTCTANCGPQLVAPLAEANTYHSDAFGYEVDYSSNWKVRSQDANGILVGTQIGIVQVTGSKSGPSTGQLIDNAVAALPSSKWQSVIRVSDIRGAHIGVQDGEGAIYSANLIGPGTTATKVRFAVIAAVRGSVAVVIFAADPADTKDFASGIPEGQEFDYLCQEFRWAN
ncbi:MAG TPA: zinc-ribbon domain-containing protein [Candidatus Micrarchaeaceae archaeon]|nr:zinc-ribbon domain-containing protein [Candidatus Micrarchaeaceae archaeon]